MSFLLTGAAYFAVLLLGAVVQGASGFGMAIVVMSILPFFLSVKTTAVAMLPAMITTFVIILLRQRSFIDYRLLAGLLPGIFIGRTLGTWGLTVLPDETMRLILGCLLLLLALYFLLFRKKIRLSADPVTGSIAGGLSGLLSGLSNVGGPPLVLYLFSACPDKRVYQGTITATFMISALFSILLHALFGNIGPVELRLSLFGILGSLAGTGLGLTIFHHLPRAALSWIIIGLTAFSGISMLIV